MDHVFSSSLPRLTFLFVVLAAAGCDGPRVEPDAGPMAIDAPFERPDGSRSCTSDTDCDDGVDCTVDACNAGGFCENRTNPSVCQDDVFCNGIEVCHPLRGCEPGPRESCNDSDVCTIDRCNESAATCEHDPRDLDDDGDVDFNCTGGGDCDDFDASRSSLVNEICDDGIDNDCDETTDELDCGRAPHDRCTAGPGEVGPLDVSTGGTFVVSNVGAVNDYMICQSDRDIVATFTIPAGTGPRDVRIEAQGDVFSAGLALRTTCEDVGSQLECRPYGFPSVIRRRSLPEGQYWLIVSGGFSSTESNVTLNVEISPPSPVPTNETCASPVDLPAGGGTVMGSFVDVTDDLTASCTYGSALDLVYRFTVPSDGPRDARIALAGTGAEYLSFTVRTTCDASATDLQCSYGSPASARLHSLAPGDYFVIVEGDGGREADFSLTVDLLDPTPRPLGDTCDAPIPLVLGAPYTGSLSGFEHDLDPSCGSFYRDAVHSVVLPADSDLTVTVDSATYAVVAMREAPCTDGAPERVCRGGGVQSLRFHDLPAGTYYFIVESPNLGAYTITATAVTPPVVPTVATGNDLCGGATVVPPTGGYFTGSTLTMLNQFFDPSRGDCYFNDASGPDVAFQLDIPGPRHVILSTEGSEFDTMILLYQSSCTTLGGGELDCSDNEYGYGLQSVIDTTLTAGTYFAVVDGTRAGAAGTYYFEAIIEPVAP